MPKKPVTNKLNTGNTSTNADRPAAKGFTHKRSRATINRLKMYNTRPIRNKGGKILGGSFMSSELPSNTRIAPSSSYFGPTRFIGQEQLAAFREAINKTKQDPFKVLLRPGKIPMGLITESKAEPKVKILDTESYESVFGPKKQRKRPRITQFEYSDLVTTASEKAGEYDDTKDKNIRVELDMWDERRHDVFEKGHSKRIYAELYKVLDASDVVIQVLDARDPMGTRSPHLEKHIKENARYKHLVLILNKCDLIPAWATARWVSVLSKEYPTLAFHSSLTHPFGKGALITLLRQFSKLHSDKKQIGVGFVGYPNVGKSSIINTLKASKVCKAAPIPGQTKIWQYVRLTRKINLIDCPGVVPPQEKNDTEVVLRGVIRVENLPDATEFVPAVLERVKKEYVARHYNLPATWTDAEDFLIKLAEKSGKLLKKGEPDVVTVSKLVLYDWQKGRLPFFSLPPLPTALEEAKAKALKEEQERLEKEAEEKRKERQERIDRGEIDEDDHEEAPKVEAADLNVAQNFGRINVKHAYDEDDTNPEGKGVSFSDAPDWDDLFKSVEADMGSDDEIDSEDDHGDNNDVISDGEDNDEEDGEDGDDVIEVKDDDDDVIEIKDDEEEEDVDLAPKKSKKARIEKSEAKSAKSEAKPVKSEKVAKSDKNTKSKQTSTPPAKPTKTTKTAKATTPTPAPAAKPTKATPNKTPTTTTKTTPAAQTSTTKTTPTTKTTKKTTPVKKELLIPYEQQSKSRARNVSDDDEIIDDETERKPKKIITSLKTKKVKLIDGGGKRVISFDEQAADNKRKRRGGASGKEKRMTTNKKKAGVHFYATANVKNRRNRSNQNAQNDD